MWVSIQAPQSMGFSLKLPRTRYFTKNCFSFPSHWVSEFKHWQFPVPSFLVSLLQVGFHYSLDSQCLLSSTSIVLRSFLWLLSLITAMWRSFMMAQQIAETWGSGSLPRNRVTLGSLSEKSDTFFFPPFPAEVFWNRNVISWMKHAMSSPEGLYEAAQIKASDSVCLPMY